MKNLFLLYACAEKFRAAKIGAINVSLSPKASMAEFHAVKREDAMKFLEFLGARCFDLRAAERRFEILKFAPELSNRFEILKFTLAPHKFKPAPIPLLNFISNFTPHASTFKFENGVKFKRGAR